MLQSGGEIILISPRKLICFYVWHKKIFALALVAAFLVSTPLALAGSGSEVCNVIFIYKADDSFGKPPGPGGNPKSDLGYAFLKSGYEWKDLPITVYLDDEMVSYKGAIESAMAEWDIHTVANLFVAGVTVVSDASFDSSARDSRNELVFGDYPQSGVIAVCSTWFYRFGKDTRIVEFDIMFDNKDFNWGTDGGALVMDVQNIATHEIGHGLGLSDLYNGKWSEQTMYGYADEGQINKRTLDSGDIAGIQALYGV